MKVFFVKLFLVAGLSSLLLFSCQSNAPKLEKENHPTFTFVFMTDIHITPERNAVEGFRKAIDTVNKINPDFVITGGDLIMDALGQTYDTAKLLYDLYLEEAKRFKIPVYNTMGNHEVYGIYLNDSATKAHPEYNERMFEHRIGRRYYSFDHKGWHFVVLDAIEETFENKYIGGIDSIQKEWIRNDIEKLDKKTPIVLSTHIPFVTAWTQLKYGVMEANKSNIVVSNGNEILDLFEGYNLKMVLQGHLHFIEDLNINGTHFITGGAVSAKWWTGDNDGVEEGFMKINVFSDGHIRWEYIDFAWDGETMSPTN